jgi:hypothetical protein
MTYEFNLPGIPALGDGIMKGKYNLNYERRIMITNHSVRCIWQKTMLIFFILLVAVAAVSNAQAQNSEVKERRILVSEYRNKMMAGWIGQMVGVGWGAPTEFRYMNRIIPDDEVPKWKPEMVNVWGQDDLYVEMTFLRSLEIYGLDVSIRQAGIDFANNSSGRH